MAIIAFIVVAIPTFGVMMKEDPVGRAIFAVGRGQVRPTLDT